MVRYAIPAAILLAVFVHAWIWRWDILVPPSGRGLMLLDRWTQTIRFCDDKNCVQRFSVPPPLREP